MGSRRSTHHTCCGTRQLKMIDEDWIRIGDMQVDPGLLKTAPTVRCTIAQCRAACCGHGVYVDLFEATRIVEAADLIRPHLPVERRDIAAWFDGNVEVDPDFPSGFRVGTEVLQDVSHPAGTRCVFLRPEDDYCAIQYASMSTGQHPWDLKPFYCALYPLVTQGDKLQLDDQNALFSMGGSCQRAAPVPLPLYVLMKEEMVLALGDHGYEQFRLIARTRAGVS